MKQKREAHIEINKKWASVAYPGQYKTAIPAEQSWGYYIKTRVNYLTACLWLAERNKKVEGRDGFISLPTKPNWLVMVKRFRRDQDDRIAGHEVKEEPENDDIEI